MPCSPRKPSATTIPDLIRASVGAGCPDLVGHAPEHQPPRTFGDGIPTGSRRNLYVRPDERARILAERDPEQLDQ